MNRTDSRKTITVAHFWDAFSYPPVLNLVDNLLSSGHRVHLICYNAEKLPEHLLANERLDCVSLRSVTGRDPYHRMIRGFSRIREGKAAVRKCMADSDILWTTTDLTVRTLGRTLLDYRHVMQLMELLEWYPQFYKIDWWKFPIDRYARAAWKVVVPEINRAYIQKVWWNLERLPAVLPNKPFRLSAGDPSEQAAAAIERMKRESRKIILYLGVITAERSLEFIAKTLRDRADQYCLYIAGRALDSENQSAFDAFLKNYPEVVYLGFFRAPDHLNLIRHAHIGVLPYHPKKGIGGKSSLNALYCAPNKIFEYAGFGVPMAGTQVMGLQYPFDLYHMGVCYEEGSANSLVNCLEKIEQSYTEMSEGCIQYYNSVDLSRIVEQILYDEEEND